MHRPAVLSLLSVLLVQPKTSFAHMLLAQPQHIGQINNSPLEGPNAVGGGKYPCKFDGNPSFYEGAVRTTIPLGSNYTAKFTGSAVHGGGSCQFSLSKDLAPTPESVFKVIYSIQGGCPARNTPGNIGNDASMADPYEYPFTMPPDLEPGQYTFAWTWINKVGNREFYMNCAAVDVTATADYTGNAEYYNTLPDLTLVNIDGVDCASEPDNGQGSFKYQNPGAFVETNEALQYVQKQCFAPIGSGSSSGSAASQGNQPSISAIASSSSAADATATAGLFFTNNNNAVSQSSTPSQAPQEQQSTVTPTGFATVVTTNPAQASAPASSSAVQSSTAGSPQATDSDENKSSDCPSTWVPCTATGFFCIDTTHFGLCNFGCMPMVQALAEGVGCDITTNTLIDLRQSHN